MRAVPTVSRLPASLGHGEAGLAEPGDDRPDEGRRHVTTLEVGDDVRPVVGVEGADRCHRR